MNDAHAESDMPIEKQYPKLVRDKIPEIIEQDGMIAVHHHEEDTAKYIGYLFAKLHEEATELSEASTPDHRIEEFADVKEVLISLQQALGLSETDIETVRKEKYEERGGFLGRIILDELAGGSPLLNVRVINTDEELAIPDVEPLGSAKVFWKTSDEIWRQKPERLKIASYSLAVPASEARDALNEVLAEINQELVVSGAEKAVRLKGFRPNVEVELSPEFLKNPSDAFIGTCNWDDWGDTRHAYINGKIEGVAFTDDHKDMHRELYAGLGFSDINGHTTRLTYSMQRIQGSQDCPTSLTKTIWHSQFAETGYEGNHLQRVELSLDQEFRVLRVFRVMTELALSNS